jgi:uncharacterized membrane protein SirB2
MIKLIHLSFVLFALINFVGKFVLSYSRPELLTHSAVKIAHHVISGLLILSGIILVFQGDWLSGAYGWIIAKIIVLLGFIGLGVLTMRSVGTTRWLAFAGAIACFLYIAIVAVTKNPLWFL